MPKTPLNCAAAFWGYSPISRTSSLGKKGDDDMLAIAVPRTNKNVALRMGRMVGLAEEPPRRTWSMNGPQTTWMAAAAALAEFFRWLCRDGVSACRCEALSSRRFQARCW